MLSRNQDEHGGSDRRMCSGSNFAGYNAARNENGIAPIRFQAGSHERPQNFLFITATKEKSGIRASNLGLLASL